MTHTAGKGTNLVTNIKRKPEEGGYIGQRKKWMTLDKNVIWSYLFGIQVLIAFNNGRQKNREYKKEVYGASGNRQVDAE